MNDFFSNFPTILAVFFLVLLLGFSTRMVWRHIARSMREKQVGELQWYLLKPESMEGSAAASSIQSQTNSVKSFLQVLVAKKPYHTRSVVSFVWNKTKSENGDGMIRLYVGQDSSNLSNGETAIRTLARGLNFREEKLDGPPPIATGGLVVAYRNRYTPSGVELIPSAAGAVASVLSDASDAYGTVVLTMEDMRNSETKRLEAMITEDSVMRQGETAKYSSDVGNKARTMMSAPIRVSIGASSYDGSPARSESLLRMVIGSISTMGMSTSTNDPANQHNRGVSIYSGLYLVALGAATFFGFVDLNYAIMLGVAPLALFGLSLVNSPLLARDWITKRLAKGEIVVPSFFWVNPRWALHGLVRSYRHDAGGNEQVGNRIAPPSCKQVIAMYPSSVTEFVSISSKASSAMDIEKETTPSVAMPSKFEQMNTDDLFLGASGTNQVVSLPLEDIHHNFLTVGAPESGKTNFLQVMYANMCRLSEYNDLRYQITPIWMETKGQGAYETWPLVNQANKDAKFIDTHNPRSGYRLSLEGRRLSEGATPDEVIANCSTLVSAMQFAWGDGIQASSREALDYAFRIGMLLLPQEIKMLGLEDMINIERPNVIRLAHFILGGDLRIQLGGQLQQIHDELGSDDSREYYLKESISTLGPYLKEKDRSAEERRKAPLNKLSDLRRAEVFWGPDDRRKDIYVRDIINNFAPVVVNLGPHWVPETQGYKNIDGQLAKKLTLMATHIQWSTIKAECNGWGKAGKRVPVFYDEASDIAPDSDSGENVIAEVGAKARAMGCAFYLGTQNLNQLPHGARHEVLAFRSKVYFQLPNADDADIVLANIGRDTSFTQRSIQTLPTGTAIAVLKKHQLVTPPFTLRTPRIDTWMEKLESGRSVKESAFNYMRALAPVEDHRFELEEGDEDGYLAV